MSWSRLAQQGSEARWHPDDLYARIGFIVINLSRSAERVTWFYNQRGEVEQYIKEGKNAIEWTRLSCRKFRDNAVRLQLHALAYNLANFMRTLALPKEVEHWSMMSSGECRLNASVRNDRVWNAANRGAIAAQANRTMLRGAWKPVGRRERCTQMTTEQPKAARLKPHGLTKGGQKPKNPPVFRGNAVLAAKAPCLGRTWGMSTKPGGEP